MHFTPGPIFEARFIWPNVRLMSVFPFLGSILTHCLSHDNRALLLLCIVPQVPGHILALPVSCFTHAGFGTQGVGSETPPR